MQDAQMATRYVNNVPNIPNTHKQTTHKQQALNVKCIPPNLTPLRSATFSRIANQSNKNNNLKKIYHECSERLKIADIVVR